MSVHQLPPSTRKEKVTEEEEDSDLVYACSCGCVLFYVKEDGMHCSTCGNIMFYE